MGLKNYVVDEDGNMIPTGRRNFCRISNRLIEKRYPSSPQLQKPISVRFINVKGRKRTIRVMFNDNISGPLEMENIEKAAAIADKRGWKRVVIDTDMFEGYTFEVFNMAMFHATFRSRYIFGVFLMNRPCENQQ